MVDRTPERDDIIVVTIPGNEIAEELGSRRLTNMVLLGGLLKALPVLPLEAIEKALAEHLPERHKKLLPQNYQALRAGANYEQRPLSDLPPFGLVLISVLIWVGTVAVHCTVFLPLSGGPAVGSERLYE